MEKRSQLPIWASLLAFVALILLGYGVVHWVHVSRANTPYANPFLHVTNRDYSLFLWQNPEMIGQGRERGYFSAFGAQGNESWLDPILADEMVVSPEYQLMRYHAWNIYARDYLPQRTRPTPRSLNW